MRTILVTMASAFLLASCGKAGKDDGPLDLHGNVDVRQVSVAFEETGRVAEMRVEEGATVQAGTVLATLDTVSLRLQAEQAQAQADVQRENLRKLRNGSRPEEIAQAEAQLTAARADAARAADDLARLRGIAQRTQGRGVSAQELDRAGRDATSADARVREQAASLRIARRGPRNEDVAGGRAQVAAADAELALLRHRVGQGELRAPVDGVVRSRLLEVGDMASPQQPAYELSLTKPKWVRAYVGEADLGRIRPGMAAQVVDDTAPDRPVAGRIGYIASTAEFTPKSVQTEDLRTSLVYEVRVTMDDRTDRLRLGQPVTVRIATDPNRGAAR